MQDKPSEPKAIPEHVRQAMDAVASSLGGGDVFYCHICDGLRKRKHECECWACGRPREQCECESEEGDDDGK